MKLEYMTTKDFLKVVEGIGLKVDIRAATLDIYLDAHKCATINRHKLLSFEVNTEELGQGQTSLLINAILCYVNTPVSKRTTKECKLKVYDTDLYLNYISDHDMTVTKNKKAAKTYNDADVYSAKVAADNQGVALTVEMVDVDD